MNLVNPYRFGGSAGFEPEYQDIIDYANTNVITLPSESQQIIQNQFMIDLKAAISLSAFDVFYLFANDAGQDFSWINWASNKAFSQSGTWDWFNNDGLAVAASVGVPFTSSINMAADFSSYTLNDCSYGFRVGLGQSWGTSESPFQAYNSGVGGVTLQNIGSTATRLNSSTNTVLNGGIEPAFATDLQYSNVNRISSSQIEYIANGVLQNTYTQNTTIVATEPLIFGKVNGAFTKRFQLLYFGRSITVSEALDINTAINDYLITI